MAQVGVSRSVAASWCRSGFLAVEQGTPLGPHWIRLTDEDRARLDGTRAAHGSGRWRLREAQRVLNLTEKDLYRHIREGQLIAYRAHIGDHWEWRGDPADKTKRGRASPAVGVRSHAEEG